MANVKISELADGAPIDGTEDLPIVKGGVTVRCSTQDIADLSVQTNVVSISSADILQLNTTPKTIVPAQGAGKFIMPLSVLFKVNFGTTAYATNTNLRIKQGASFDPLITVNSVLAQIADTLIPKVFAPNITASSYSLNEPLQVYVQTGNPTAGDGTIDIYVSYIVITL